MNWTNLPSTYLAHNRVYVFTLQCLPDDENDWYVVQCIQRHLGKVYQHKHSMEIWLSLDQISYNVIVT